MPDFSVALNRKFYPASEDTAESGDYASHMGYGLVKPTYWDAIFQKPRVVILAEAGAGKTYELENATKALRSKGKPAFFIRLEYLKDGIEVSLDGTELGSFKALEAWKKTSEEGWIFLDSVDEAKLNNPSDFELALRKLSNYLGDRLQQTNIVMSCRPTWEPESEPALVRRILPYEPKSTEAESDDVALSAPNKINTVGEKSTSAQKEGPNQQPEIYSLAPLDAEQIKTFSLAKGVDDADAMVEAIARADVMQLASRPRDLEHIIEYWVKEKAIGSKLELIRSSVKRKFVEEDTKRSEKKPLSKEKAMAAVKLIAAVTTLTPISRISVPSRGGVSGAIKIESILPDWSTAECKTLLERPIFDGAAYGTVRFHDRDSREFLVAEWFADLLSGGSRKEIESLFFKIQYENEISRPKLRPILPWIALKDGRIREKALKISPSILLDGGDPSQFPAEFRTRILTAVCQEMAGSESIHHSFDISAIERFAKKDIAKTILGLLIQHKDHGDIRQLLLRMIWQGKLALCKGQAMQFALDQSADRYTRIYAIRACQAICTTQEQRKIVDHFVNCDDGCDLRTLSELIRTFAPNTLDIPELLTILKRVPELEEFKTEGLDYALMEMVKSLALPKLKKLITGLRELLVKQPHIERLYCGISVRYAWLLEATATGLERIIVARNQYALSSVALELISQCGTYRDFGNGHSFKSELGERVPKWPELNKAAFWYDTQRARKIRDNEVTAFWQVFPSGHYWSLAGVSFETALEWIDEQEQTADKQVALSLAFTIYREAGRQRKQREALWKAVRGDEALETALSNYMRPPPMSAQDQKHHRWERNHKARMQRRKDQKKQNLKDWREIAANNLELVGYLDKAHENKFYSVQNVLYDRMRKFDKDYHGRWAYTNWQDLKSDQNDDVAFTFRNFLINCWRKYTPALASDGSYNSSSTENAEIYGLSGLGIEAKEVEDWPANLSDSEAKLAGRYLLSELNGFPDWFMKLHTQYPEVVDNTLLREIEWELFDYDGEKPCHYVLDKITWHGALLKPHLSQSIFNLLEQNEPTHLSAPQSALGIIVASSEITDGQLATLAEAKVSKKLKPEHLSMWYAIWVSTAPKDAIPKLREHLNDFNDPSFSMEFVVNLMGTRHSRIENIRDGFRQPEFLGDLYSLINEHVHMSEDIDRAGTGCYSPELRDNAQDARSSLLTALTEIPGKASYVALKKLAAEHPHSKARPWMENCAMSHAEKEADLGEWNVENVLTFQKSQEYQPSDAGQLFEKTCSRLADLKSELEDGEDSPASTWKREDQEINLRIIIAKWLRDCAKSMYSVHQEEEQADRKKPDIRMYGQGFDAPVPIELKIADNWSGAELLERLKNQLCNDYLRDYRTCYGVFLLVYRGEKQHWEHPKTSERMDFQELIKTLQIHAIKFIRDRNDIESVQVIGMDLTKRAVPKRE